MLRKALVLVLLVAGIAACTGCGVTANQYVYGTLPTANQIVAYREDPNSGTLTELAGSPYTAGDGASSLVIHPNGRFVYVSNPGQGEDDISLFNINGNGSLTEVTRTSVLPNTLPEFLAMDPAGNYLYAANVGSNNISVFSIDSSSGMLAAVTGSPFNTGLAPLNMTLSPTGNFLYIGASGQRFGFIEGFSVAAGVLTGIGVTNSDGPNPDALAIDPSGTHLYVANSSSASSLSVYNISSSGTLTEVQGAPISDTYSDPLALVLDPGGTFLYLANEGSANVASYSISSSTGLPAILTNSTTTGAFSTEPGPSVLASDPTGRYLFVGSQGSNAGIQVFEVIDGNLTEVFTYGTGSRPSSIAILGPPPAAAKK
jgi:6-phosphogluconolactonase (cycloisomerase 2 family)